MTVKNNISRIEQLTIGGIVLTFFLTYFTRASFWALVFQSLFLLLLVFYSIAAEKNLYRLFLAGFATRILGSMGILATDVSQILIYIGSGFMSAFGVLVLLKAIRDSLKYKGFEMISFLTGIFITLSPLPLFPVATQILQFYNFALCFLVFTIMYNDNLWSRYSFDEKRILVFIVILALVNVLTFSLKFI